MTPGHARAPRIPLELLGFIAILALAAVLRLVDLPTRGTWDADQGHDMLVLRGILGGILPTLGPPTSIGDFHHGVLYYVLLAPAALVSGADPLAVTTWIALGGIVAVAVTGWLARSIGGPIAGLTAALLMALSASAVEESTFIWNPNLVALSSSIALAAGWQAWRSRRAGWWVVAGAAAVVTMHCHVLGVVLSPVIAALLVADIRRRRSAGDRAGSRAVAWAGLGWLAIGALSYVPLLVHEQGSSGSEFRAGIAFLTSGGGSGGSSLLERLPVVALRIVSWPLTGLVTNAPLAAMASGGLVVALAAWRGWLGAVSAERVAVRWLALGLLWSSLGLAAGASGLATVVPGLPNDHYHAFADPMVYVIVGVGIAALARLGASAGAGAGLVAGAARVAGPGRASPLRGAAGPIAAAVLVVVLAGWNLLRQPAAVAADGGWPAAQRAAARIIAVTGGGTLVLSSLPTFKTDEAVRFPLARAGVEVAPLGPLGPLYAGPGTPRVVLCDQLFREVIGADCGGSAEDAWVVNPASNLVAAAGAGPGPLRAVERFEAAPGRWVSIYLP